MGFFGLDKIFPVWSRDKTGTNFYDWKAYEDWTKGGNTLAMSENHPILTPALLFISKIFSQAEISVRVKSTKKVIPNNNFAKLLEKPNWFQTTPDLLEELSFTTIANGIGVIWAKRTIGLEPNSLYVLNHQLFDFPDDLDKGNFKNKISALQRMGIKVKYDENGENLSIPLNELMFFYDVPNSSKKNKFEAVSRITGIKQTLLNSCDSEKAKNIIIKSNGKELITGSKEGFPLLPDEKEKIEKGFNNSYGLGFGRRRGLVTNANINWKSMHVIMRDLGHEESIKGDASIIFTALHLPQDVYSISGAKSTYKNANQSLVSYIQNEIQPTLNSFISTLNAHLFPNDDFEFYGSYENMPVMLEFKKVKYEGIIAQVGALEALIRVGFDPARALEMTGFEKTTKLNPPEPKVVEQAPPANESKEDYINRIVREANQ